MKGGEIEAHKRKTDRRGLLRWGEGVKAGSGGGGGGGDEAKGVKLGFFLGAGKLRGIGEALVHK